jgi:2-polyprenyl-3-methyl-5-hydroxy-6-metoxy-1,4-benzoquinol methylase
MIPELAFTGERFVPGIGGAIALEHFHRFALACELTVECDVLDLGCGEGYGSRALADRARSVLGVDSAEEAVHHASCRYRAPRLRFAVGSCDRIPADDASFDWVICFETIEHHDRHHEMLVEIRRVLRPDGHLLLSTPNAASSTGEANPFHLRELDRHALRELVAEHFDHIQLLAQKVTYSSLIVADDERAEAAPLREFQHGAWPASAAAPARDCPLMLCLASDAPLPPIGATLYTGTTLLEEERALHAKIIAKLAKRLQVT